jgi:hypothetical protein
VAFARADDLDPGLAADLPHRHAGVGQLQEPDNLGLGELRLLNFKPPGVNMPGSSTYYLSPARGSLLLVGIPLPKASVHVYHSQSI